MALPNDRRIIFGSELYHAQSIEMEETAIRKEVFVTPSTASTLNGTTGGKGIVPSGALNLAVAQWNDGWTSMFHSDIHWEDLDDSTDASGNRWEDTTNPWNGILELSTTAHQLSIDTNDYLAFLYIKNTGDTNNVLVSIDNGGTYYIIVPPGGSVNLRGVHSAAGSTSLDRVLVKSSSGTTTIEYIIAKVHGT